MNNKINKYKILNKYRKSMIIVYKNIKMILVYRIKK